MVDTLNKDELIKYLNDLKTLKNSPEFQRFMYGNFTAIEYLQDQLDVVEPTDSVRIAKLQGEVQYRKKLQREYEDCEKLIFSLASMKKPAISNNLQGGGLAPPDE